MKEPQQVQQEPQQVTAKEPQQVTMKDPKKVEVGKRLAAINCKRREAKKAQSEGPSGGVSQYYSVGAVIVVGVIGCLGYCLYRTKKGEAPPPQQPSHLQRDNPPKTNKFEMD